MKWNARKAVAGLGVGCALGPATRVEWVLEYRPSEPFADMASFLASQREQLASVERSRKPMTVGMEMAVDHGESPDTVHVQGLFA